MRLVGHEAIVHRFDDAMRAGRLHHAWLLHGQPGIGKHVLARHLAQRYLCEAGTACGRCHGCRMWLAEAHPDACLCAPEQGKRDLNIAQIRMARDFLALSGSESERRVVIIDDGDRMNPQAANALLKVLEEPAPGSLLLIVCADLARLPATVRSRCLLAACAPLREAEVAEVLRAIGVDEAHRSLVQELAAGCPGRVACMREAAIAEAVAEWRTLTRDVARADIGAIERWLTRHVRVVPHELIVEIVLRAQQAQMREPLSYAHRRAIDDALWALVRWPDDVRRHSLRIAPSFMALFMTLRLALREARA